MQNRIKLTNTAVEKLSFPTGAVTRTINGTLTQTVTEALTVNADTSMTVNTPSWTVSGAKQAFWTSSFLRGTPARATVVLAAADLWGVRQQVYAGINSQWSTVKLDLAAFKNGDNGFEFGGAATQIKGIGIQVKSGVAGIISRVANIFP